MVVLAGLVATILLSAWLFAAPAIDLPFVDIPRALGGVVTSDSRIAFAIGYALFFIGGTFVLSLLIIAVWSLMPGSGVALRGAAIKGVLWGAAVWLATGIALGIASALNRGTALPGWFAANTGVAGVVWLFAGCIAYGLALALVIAMEHGITALDTLGWSGYYHASTGPTWLDEHRSLDVPQPTRPAEALIEERERSRIPRRER
jgi:hypothetical protein